MDNTPKFVKYLSESDLESNEMRIPTLFWEKVANLFPNSVKLFFRNGFNLWVGYDNFEGVFTGVEKIYQEFGLKKGDTLLFEYVSMYNFRVFIIGAHFSEIQYPLVNSGPSREDVKHDGGLKFVYFLSCGQTIVEKVVRLFVFFYFWA
ncbi:hypothetical protein ACET3Z_003109 [Daucus carota]